jgi:uncharacterized membrane protein
MTQTEKRSVFILVIWGLVACGVAAAFFGGGGPRSFGADQGRIVATAVVLGFGFGAFFLMLYLTRSRPGVTPLVVDERDETIAARAGVITLVVVLSSVYLTCIVLWELHRGAGCVPVGWLWFLGYGAVICTYLCHATVTLVLNHRTGGRGQG